MESSFSRPWSPPWNDTFQSAKPNSCYPTAIDAADYRKARKEVRKLGLDPDSIPHLRPK
jgi:hypothetical protein